MSKIGEVKRPIKLNSNEKLEPIWDGDVYGLPTKKATQSELVDSADLKEQLCEDFYVLYMNDPKLLKISIQRRKTLINLVNAIPIELIEDFSEKLSLILGDKLLIYPEVIRLINEKKQLWYAEKTLIEETKESCKRG